MSKKSEPVSAPFVEFCAVADAVGATASRLEKSAILGDYFRGLDDADLSLAARYLAGYAFPLRDQRTTNVGGAAIFGAIQSLTGRDLDELRSRYVALGDSGELAHEAFEATPASAARLATLTISDLAEALDRLAETAGAKKKAEVVRELLEAATPVEAKYLVKLLAGDLRIGLKEGSVEDAIARLYAQPIARVQWANMLVGDIGETALLARRGELETARMHLFHPMKSMLATAAEDLDAVRKQMPDTFVVEDKYDGIRAQAHVAPASAYGDDDLHGVVVNGARVAIFSRTLDEITHSYPDVVPALAALAPAAGAGLLLDGEILPVRGDEVLPFQSLQKRLGRKKLTDEMLAEVPVAFVAYDALYADGRVLIDEPFSTRRAVIEALPFPEVGARPAPSKRFTDVAALDDEFDAARARGNEGLMVKDPDSRYKPGRRGREWLKIKRALATLDVVVTSVEVGHGKRRDVLSDYTFAVRASESDPTLLNVGKAYSGLTDAEIAELTTWFREHTLQEFAHGRVRVVEPRVVIEVTFDRVQPSKRHKSGFALRFPRIVRLRPDKSADEIDTLDAVRALSDDAPSE